MCIPILNNATQIKTAGQLPCDGERPASWWRSSLISCRRGPCAHGWDRNPFSPLPLSARLGPTPSRTDQRTPRPCRQLLPSRVCRFVTRGPLCIGKSDLERVALAFFRRFRWRTTLCFHVKIVVQKSFASTLDAAIKCTTINRGKNDTTIELSVRVILITCQHESAKKHGRDRNGNQRFRCLLCGETWTEQGPKPLGNMRISMKDARDAIFLLCEGNSIRTIERFSGLHRDTIDDLILVAGENCRRLLESKVRAVPVKDVQVDEIWSFVGMKERARVAAARSSEWGDSWTFIAIERETKLVLAHCIGQRDMATSVRFLNQLDRATAGRFQLSSDGLGSYTLNVPFVLGSRVDFAQLVKNFASAQTTVRYSPAKISGCEKKPQFGNPDFDRICTSHVERLNLTMRMNLRRFTRLTNGHSKSLKHHVAMQSLLFAWYNFCRKHMTIKTTPAVASGVADRVWSLPQLLEFAAAV